MLKDEVVRLLLGCGFTLRTVTPAANHHLFAVERTELLGTRSCYHIAVAENGFSEGDAEGLAKRANRAGASLVLVGASARVPLGIPVLTPEQFIDRLGGHVPSLLPLDSKYGDRIKELGLNRLPPPLIGDPSDLFEKYVHEGLQFILGMRVVRYGQERRFEKVADGIAIGDGTPLALYDAKAYEDGYDVNSDSIRQFASYVNDFNQRYERQTGRASSFLVMSGKFKNGKASMQNKSRDLQADAGIGLCFVRADALAGIVALLVQKPHLRKAINWKRLLVNTELTVKMIEDEIAARERDAVLQV